MDKDIINDYDTLHLQEEYEYDSRKFLNINLVLLDRRLKNLTNTVLTACRFLLTAKIQLN